VESADTRTEPLRISTLWTKSQRAIATTLAQGHEVLYCAAGGKPDTAELRSANASYATLIEIYLIPCCSHESDVHYTKPNLVGLDEI
jgi:hypothetical protein